MNNHAIIVLIIGLLILTLLFLMITAFRSKRGKTIPNYRAMFIIGIAILPSGFVLDNPALWIVGIVFMIIGLANRKQWGQQTKWSDLSSNAKKVKLLLVGGLLLLSLLCVAAYFFFGSS